MRAVIHKPCKGVMSRIILLMAIMLSTVSLSFAADYSDLKLTTTNRGLYYVSATEMAFVLGVPDAEIEGMISTGTVQVSHGDVGVSSIYSSSGAGLYFYSDQVDSIYTEDDVYVISWTSRTQMTEISAIPYSDRRKPSSAATDFRQVLHFEEEEFSAVGYFTDPSADYWFWKTLVAGDATSGSYTNTFQVSGLSAAGGQAQLTVNLYGVTSTDALQEHHAVITINGTQVGDNNWDGKTNNSVVVTFDQSLLNNGANEFVVTAVLDAGVAYSIFYLDSFELDYNRASVVADDYIIVKGGSNEFVTIEGFTDEDIYLLNISDPDVPQLLINPVIKDAGGTHRLSFKPANATDEYLALRLGESGMPSIISAIDDVGLKDVTNRAEYIIITVPELETAAMNLATYRKDKKIETKVVFIEDIYNAFSGGVVTPAAIRSFLEYAYNTWSRSPRYVVLAGEGTYDYKNIYGYFESLVPAVLAGTPYGLFASDGWYVDFDDDFVPEIAIGRLPAMTDAELQQMIDNVKSHEWSPVEPWHKSLAFSADDPDDGGNFTASSDVLAGLVPGNYSVSKIYLDTNAVATSRGEFITALNQGVLLMNYIGHSGLDQLASEGLFRSSDVASLDNSEMLPLVTTMSCVLGRFAIPGFDCLGEELMLGTNGGASAVWAPSGLSYSRSLDMLNYELYGELLTDGEGILGDAVRGALSSYSQRDGVKGLSKIYNLLGDPGMIMAGIDQPSDNPYAPVLTNVVAWKEGNWTEEELLNVALTGDFSDPDGDDIPNIMEYALARQPGSRDGVKIFTLSTKESSPPVEFDVVARMQRRKNLSGITTTLSISQDMVTWESAAGYVVHTEVTDDGNGETETVAYYIDAPGSSKKVFIRLKVIKD